MTLCLFCDQTLNAKTRPEHILLNALGGRKTSRLLICSGCNEWFGSTIDRDLALSVADIRNLLGHRSGGGNPAPAISYSTALGTVKLSGEGRPTLTHKPFELERGEGGLNISIHANNREELARTIKNLAAHIGCSPEYLLAAFRAGTGQEFHETYIRPPSRRGQLSFGSVDALRSIVKACLELLALAIGNDFVRSEMFARARHFVIGAEADFNVRAIDLDSRELPREGALRQRFGPAFHLISITSERGGRAIGYFRMYGSVAWTITLGTGDEMPEVATSLVCDPVAERWSVVDPDARLPLQWLERPEFDAQRVTKAFNEVMKVAQYRAMERETDRIVRSEFGRHGIVDDEVVEDEAIKESVFREIIARVSSIVANTPYSRPLDWAEVHKIMNED